MSDTPAAASAEQKPKSKKLLFIIIIAVVVVAGLGAGGFFYFKRASAAGETETAEKTKKGDKKDSKKEKEAEAEAEDAEAEETASEKPEKEAGAKKAKFSISKLDLPDDKDVKHVIALEPFIVNLADANDARYLRMAVSIGVGETKEEKPDALLMTRVRNAMLAVLGTKTSEQVLTLEGKSALRKELLRVARAAVEEPHIEAIYITDFIVQL